MHNHRAEARVESTSGGRAARLDLTSRTKDRPANSCPAQLLIRRSPERGLGCEMKVEPTRSIQSNTPDLSEIRNPPRNRGPSQPGILTTDARWHWGVDALGCSAVKQSNPESEEGGKPILSRSCRAGGRGRGRGVLCKASGRKSLRWARHRDAETKEAKGKKEEAAVVRGDKKRVGGGKEVK